VAAIAAIEQLGAAVTVLAADVADAASMAALFARFGQDLPPLRGVIHAAADWSSAPLAAMEEASLDKMLRPKVGGTWNLHTLSAGHALDFFVLFSSTTALLGVAGLGHYAAASAYLDAFAHYRRGLGLPALSINWGTWSNMRAASGADQQRAAEVGLERMPAAQALELLGDLLHEQQPPQVVVAAVNWDALKPAFEARRRRPLLASLGQAEARSAAATPAAAAAQEPPLLAAWRTARPDEREEVLIAALRATVARIVGVKNPATIDLHQGLFEMGLDSLMSVELKTQLERQVGRALPSTLTFNYPTIYDLAGYLVAEVLATEEPTGEASAPPAPPAPVTPETGAAEDEIDDLSEDELAELLTQRLSRLL
jgi:acyl carrier protein